MTAVAQDRTSCAWDSPISPMYPTSFQTRRHILQSCQRRSPVCRRLEWLEQTHALAYFRSARCLANIQAPDIWGLVRRQQFLRGRLTLHRLGTVDHAKSRCFRCSRPAHPQYGGQRLGRSVRPLGSTIKCKISQILILLIAKRKLGGCKII